MLLVASAGNIAAFTAAQIDLLPLLALSYGHLQVI